MFKITERWIFLEIILKIVAYSRLWLLASPNSPLGKRQKYWSKGLCDSCAGLYWFGAHNGFCDIGPERAAGEFIAFYLLRQLQLSLSHFLWRMLKQACFRRTRPKTHNNEILRGKDLGSRFYSGAASERARTSKFAHCSREYFDAWSVLLPRGAGSRQDDFLPHRRGGIYVWVKYWPLYKGWHPSCRETNLA